MSIAPRHRGGCCTLLNDFIHAFVCRCFCYFWLFSYMFLRYPLKRWWKVRVERGVFPIALPQSSLTLPQFHPLQICQKRKQRTGLHLSAYEKYNTLAWELISHLWFYWCRSDINHSQYRDFTLYQKAGKQASSSRRYFHFAKSFRLFFSCWGSLLTPSGALFSRIIQQSSVDGMFNLAVMQTLFYVPFYSRRVSLTFTPDLKAPPRPHADAL